MIAKDTKKKAWEVSPSTSQATLLELHLLTAVFCVMAHGKREATRHAMVDTVTSIDTGKVLDMEALSQGCKQCEHHEHQDTTSEISDMKSWTHNMQSKFPSICTCYGIGGSRVRILKACQAAFYGEGKSKSFSRVKEFIKMLELKWKRRNVLIRSKRELELCSIN